MKKAYLLALSLVFVTAAAQTGGDQAYLGIFAETHETKIAGMKAMPAIHLPAGFKLPAAARAFMPGPPTRSLTVRLWSPSIAPDSATASIAPPSGLGQGDKLDLSLYRPTPATGGGESGGAQNANSQPQDFTIKIYWGSSPTVRDGQPKVFSMGSLTPEQQMEVGKRMKAMNPMGAMGGAGKGGGSYFYKDGWTTGYWPSDEGGTEIADTASLPGTYALSTNYTGNVSIDAPSNVDFMAPIELTSPDLSQKPDLTGALAFQWNSIPNALGQFASIVGMVGKTTLIIWTSSEVYGDQAMSDNGYLQMSEVADMVSKKIFMQGDAISMTVPAGIFSDCDAVFGNMVAYGPGTAKDNCQPIPRIQTKSSLTMILGGKKAIGPGG